MFGDLFGMVLFLGGYNKKEDSGLSGKHPNNTLPSKNERHIGWVWPPPTIPVTTRIITFVVGDSGIPINLLICHCYWEGATPKI